MRFETRRFGKYRQLLIIAETEEESKLFDNVFGKTVQTSEGHIANVKGSVQLADGYMEHYIRLQKV